MKWNDKGILIGITKFGETDQIATFVTSSHGLSRGLIKGGISKKIKPYLQIGNEFEIIWKSRLEEQLGFFTFDPIKIYGASLFETQLKLTLLSCCCNLLYESMAENHPNHTIYLSTLNLIHDIESEHNELGLLYEYMMWEFEMLSELGFALTLDHCNATGSATDLCYISPKTGHAICKTAGFPYRAKLLKFPTLWHNKNFLKFSELTLENIHEALHVLEYFFDQHIYIEKHKSIPYLRRNLGK